MTTSDADLARRMAVNGCISMDRAEQLLGEIVGIMRDVVVSGEEVRLNGFGVLRTAVLGKRAWDPQKGKRVRRKKKRVIRWKPSEQQVWRPALQEK